MKVKERQGVIMHLKIPLTLKKEEKGLEGDKERGMQLEQIFLCSFISTLSVSASMLLHPLAPPSLLLLWSYFYLYSRADCLRKCQTMLSSKGVDGFSAPVPK